MTVYNASRFAQNGLDRFRRCGHKEVLINQSLHKIIG